METFSFLAVRLIYQLAKETPANRLKLVLHASARVLEQKAMITCVGRLTEGFSFTIYSNILELVL